MAAVARYHLDSTAEHLEHLEHLIAPLLKAGWKVDDFYLYDDNLGGNAAWQPKAATFEPDPTLSKVERQDLDAAMAIAKKLKTFGADVGSSKVFNHYDTSPDDLSFISGNDSVARLWSGKKRGSIARRNFVHVHKEINMLWQQVEIQEKKKGAGFQYSYVMFIRDDAYWLKDFDLVLMLQITGGRHHSAAGGQVFSLDCEPASMRLDVHPGLVDYLFLADRTAANIFGNLYKYLIRPGDFGNAWVEHLIRTRPYNGETFYRQLTNFTGTDVTEVAAGLIPMQRVGRVDGRLCLHKTCDSKLTNERKIVVPYLHPELPKC
jgi:hypothetical protein